MPHRRGGRSTSGRAGGNSVRAHAQSLAKRFLPARATLQSEPAAQAGGQAPAERQENLPPPPPPAPASRSAAGLVYLLLVALLWGSYTPTLRLAYSLPGPPTPVAVTAASGVLELIVLLGALLLSNARASLVPVQESASGSELAAGGDGDGGVQEAQQPQQRQQQQEEPQQQERGVQSQEDPLHAAPASHGASTSTSRAALLLGLPAAVLAGVEIGAYNSVGSLSQIAGLSMTTAARGAFLIQASTLFTPILSSLAGAAPGRPIWLGSLLAFAGTLIITADRSGPADVVGGGADVAAAAATAAVPLGDALALVAALCYSAATVRIPVWAVRYRVRPVEVVLGKAVALTAVATAGLALQAAQLSAEGQPLSALWPGWAQPEGWALLLWAALGPGALAGILHIKGQSLVSPSAAQIVFCTIPLWSTLLAAAVLPGEAVGQGTWLGGAVVAAAGLVAALGGPGQPVPGAATQPPQQQGVSFEQDAKVKRK